MKKIFSLIGTIIIFLVLGISNTFACSCIQPLAPLESAETTDIIFIGKVTAINTVEIEEDFGKIEENRVDFEISRNIKGGWFSSSIQIKTPKDSATCGYNFEIGKEYIVYAFLDSSNAISVSLCSRTALLENATEDIEAFENYDENEVNSEVVENTINCEMGEDGMICDGDKEIIIDTNNDGNAVAKTTTNNKNIYIGIGIAIIAVILIIVGARGVKEN